MLERHVVDLKVTRDAVKFAYEAAHELAHSAPSGERFRKEIEPFADRERGILGVVAEEGEVLVLLRKLACEDAGITG